MARIHLEIEDEYFEGLPEPPWASDGVVLAASIRKLKHQQRRIDGLRRVMWYLLIGWILNMATDVYLAWLLWWM